MKKLNLLIFASILSFCSLAQNSSQEDIKKQINLELELTDQEAINLWKIHDEFEAEMKLLRKERHAHKPKSKKIDDLSDEEIESMIQSTFTFKEKEIQLRKQYHEKYKKVLPLSKVAKFYFLDKKLRKDHRKHHEEEKHE